MEYTRFTRDMATILVIEDDGSVRVFIRHALTFAGYEVIETSDGKSGLEAFAAHRPDLVIVDIIMPVISGLEVIWEIRCDYPDQKILATAAVDALLEEARTAGADEVLAKPFGVKDLLGKVEALLER